MYEAPSNHWMEARVLNATISRATHHAQELSKFYYRHTAGTWARGFIAPDVDRIEVDMVVRRLCDQVRTLGAANDG